MSVSLRLFAYAEHVVGPAGFSIHADLDTVVLQQTRGVQTGELAALVGVEEDRFAVAVDGFLDRFLGEAGSQGVGQLSRQHTSGSPSLSQRTDKKSFSSVSCPILGGRS
jgi:hypothetical protein